MEKTCNFDNDKINAIVTIFDYLIKSQTKEIKDNYKPTLDELSKFIEKYIKSVDDFDIYINSKIDDILEILVKKLNPTIDDNKSFELYLLYKEYGFIERNLRAIITNKEGWICSADKTRWLINKYRDYLINGNIPDMTIGEKCYWKPCFGTGKQWMNLCQGLIDLYYGNPQKYLTALKNIMES